jgi:hypothetical protein
LHRKIRNLRLRLEDLEARNLGFLAHTSTRGMEDGNGPKDGTKVSEWKIA